jgi:hypothetical protein
MTIDWYKYAIDQANLARKVPQIQQSVAGATIPDYKNGTDHECQGLGIRVFFGSDGFLQNALVREEVRILRRLLTLKGIEELGFGVDTSKTTPGKSWALVVRTDEDTMTLAAIMNAAHEVAFYRDSDMSELRSLAIQTLEEIGIDADMFIAPRQHPE